MGSPFISICIPTYKRPDLLKKLLDSIQMQNFRDFEVIISDNSPDDSVKELADPYGKMLPLFYEKNVPAVSATTNCNNAMRRAKGSWVKVMHDDDWFQAADALQQFADAALHSGKDFIFCDSNEVYLETGKIITESHEQERKKMLDESVFSLFYLNVIGHPSVVLHRKDTTLEYDPAFHWVLDIDYYMRYINSHNGFHYIPEKLVNIGKGPGQESNRYYKNRLVEIPEYFTMLAKYSSNLVLKNIYVFHMVWNMLKRYRIKNTNDIHALGYTGVMPDKIEEIIKYQERIPGIILKQPSWSQLFMRKCFKKITQGLQR